MQMGRADAPDCRRAEPPYFDDLRFEQGPGATRLEFD